MGLGSRFKGPLQKPGAGGGSRPEKSDNSKSTKLSPRGRSQAPAKKRDRYEELKSKIRAWWEDRFLMGEALREIRADKLYKKEYPTFEEFCVEEFDLKHSQVYNLIHAAEIRASLKSSSALEEITSVNQALALSPVPQKQRVKVIRQAARSGAVTARSITEAAEGVKAGGKAAVPPCAGCGGPHAFDTSIPSEAWNRVIRASGLSDYLCMSCIVQAFVKAGEGFKAALWSEELNGVLIEVVIQRPPKPL
jgi:hypothetical protein